tara:strand:- start:17 stop:295 length:279 start_codon:yes stop_codon:yes gene_type:complete
MVNLNFLINFKKYLIVTNDMINEKKIENKLIEVISKLLLFIKFLIPNKLIAANVGIDSKNETLADSYLLKFKNLAAVIVIPDLLTPGIKESV